MEVSKMRSKPLALDLRVLMAGLVLVAGLYSPTVLEDFKTYQAVISEQHGCCGFVSENWLGRPVTYALVEWTEPSWTLNAIKTERWLTSDGKVDGQKKFWRVLKREPVADYP
jgi:hypothetical protein